MRIKHIHSSGRYDRAGKLVEAAVEKYIKAGAKLITLTEMEYPEHKRALERAANKHNYGVFHGTENNRNDCAYLYAKDTFYLEHGENYKLSDASFVLGGHNTPPSYATLGVLGLHKVGTVVIIKKIVIGVYHTPSSVQQELAHKTKRLPRTRAWYINNISMRNRMNQLRREFTSDGEVISNDWNVDFKFVWAQRLIKVLFPAWKLTWLGHIPHPGGTNGSRLIDGTLLKGRIKCIDIRLFEDDASSDHRPYEEILEI